MVRAAMRPTQSLVHRAPTASTLRRQRRLWAYLTAHRHAVPVWRAMRADLGYRTNEILQKDLAMLEHAGYIRRAPNASKAISVLIPLVHLPGAEEP